MNTIQESRKLHELRMTVTEKDLWYNDLPKKEYTEEQLQQLHAREEENKRRNYNVFGDPKYWTQEYLEKKYADMETRDFENM